MDLKDVSLMDSILNDINLMQADKSIEVEMHFNYPKGRSRSSDNISSPIPSLTFKIQDCFFSKLANTPFLKILYTAKKKQKYVSVTNKQDSPGVTEEPELFSTYINTAFFESISISIERKNGGMIG